MSIAFIDLAAQQARIRSDIDAAIARVLDSGAYVMGPEVAVFETALADFGNAQHALSCANGTDAIALPLLAWEIGHGDAVFCPSFTFAATAEVIPWTGAEPVFVDVLPNTYCMDPSALERAIAAVKSEGRLTPRCVIAVDLFGQPSDYHAIGAVCQTHGLKLIADSAQGFGCTLDGKHPLHWADVTTTSFFPAKPLGGYGDGGAVLSQDSDLIERMDSLRVHGKAVTSDLAGRILNYDPKYLNMRIGMNSRLDTLQAAILLEKLKIFPDEIERRQRVAERYAVGLSDAVRTPTIIDGGLSVWAQYTIEHADRDGLMEHLKARGVPTAAYYPAPMHLQPPYAAYGAPGGLPVTEAAAKRVLSLPMHPYLKPAVQDYIVEAVRDFNG